MLFLVSEPDCAGAPPESHLIVSDSGTVDSSVSWQPSVIVKLEVALHKGHTFFNLSRSEHTNIIDLVVKAGAVLTVVDPVWKEASVQSNSMLVDQALRVTVEPGGIVNNVPIDTTLTAAAFISIEVAPPPPPPATTTVTTKSVIDVEVEHYAAISTTTTQVCQLYSSLYNNSLHRLCL